MRGLSPRSLGALPPRIILKSFRGVICEDLRAVCLVLAMAYSLRNKKQKMKNEKWIWSFRKVKKKNFTLPVLVYRFWKKCTPVNNTPKMEGEKEKAHFQIEEEL